MLTQKHTDAHKRGVLGYQILATPQRLRRTLDKHLRVTGYHHFDTESTSCGLYITRLPRKKK